MTSSPSCAARRESRRDGDVLSRLLHAKGLLPRLQDESLRLLMGSVQEAARRTGRGQGGGRDVNSEFLFGFAAFCVWCVIVSALLRVALS
jgi:hypothetical protein